MSGQIDPSSSTHPFNIESLFGTPTSTTTTTTSFGQDQSISTSISDNNNNVNSNNNETGADAQSQNGNSSKRGKTGCITCRLRKKRCDEAKPICATCSRLGIECMGYGVKRPKWLRENDNAKKAKQNIKQIVLSKRSARSVRQGSSADSDQTPQNTSSNKRNESSISTAEDDTTHTQEHSLGLQRMDIDGRGQNLNIMTDTSLNSQPNAPPHFWELGSSASATMNGATSTANNDSSLAWNISPTTIGSTSTVSTSMTNTSEPIDQNTIHHPEPTYQPQPTSTMSHSFIDPTLTITNNLYSGFMTDPSIFPPPSHAINNNGAFDTGMMVPDASTYNDLSMDALWGMLFGPQPPPEFVVDNNGSHINPNDPNNNNNNSGFGNINQNMSTNATNEDISLFASLIPSPSPGPGPGPASALSPLSTSTSSPNLSYLHHYLNVVLPLQFRIMKISISMGDYVAPLALKRNEVLTSVSALAALHMVAQRTKKRFSKNLSPKFNRLTLVNDDYTDPSSGENGRSQRPRSTSLINTEESNDGCTDNEGEDENDTDVRVAMISHQKTMERLRFITPKDLTAEEIIVPVLFGVSYHLFCGGTSKHLKELLSILQRCLSAALYSSPELGSTNSRTKSYDGPSPWARYRILIEHMVWTDILASVTNNKASPLLPMYRKLLDHLPSDNPASSNKPFLLMDRLMGSDSTTLLAMCETVALSEWKNRAEAAGCLSYKELLDRAANIERILDERAWRESHLDRPTMDDSNSTEETGAEMRRIMTDVYHGSAKVLLAVTVNGPFPRVPEIAAAVGETMEAIHRLDINHPNVQIHRAVVLPITIAGCHCETLSQQEFFRQCFERLGPEARAFGNTGPALELMEEVWKRRNGAEGGSLRVDWIQTMYDLGWENGILLI